MENTITYTKWAATLVGGILVGLLGGWDVALQVLVLFVILDYITGVIAAWYEKKLNSDVGLRGITKKVLIFVVIAVAVSLDKVIGQTILRSLAIFFYIANEGLSVLENLGRAGVAIPAPLKVALEQLKQKSEGEDKSANPHA
jgi:toxin secretion/phage lysis holin